MTQPRIQRWRCGGCNAIVGDSEWGSVPHPAAPAEDEILYCPQCGEVWGTPASPLCDEPGCDEIVCAGWPTGDATDAWNGYRRTCGAHMRTAVCLGGCLMPRRTSDTPA